METQEIEDKLKAVVEDAVKSLFNQKFAFDPEDCIELIFEWKLDSEIYKALRKHGLNNIVRCEAREVGGGLDMGNGDMVFRVKCIDTDRNTHYVRFTLRTELTILITPKSVEFEK